MKSMTFGEFNNLKVKDLTNERFCRVCGGNLIMGKWIERHDGITGVPMIGVAVVKCCQADEAFRNAGVSAYARPPKHSIPIKDLTCKIK